MFYGPGQQPGLIAPNAAGRGGLPFPPQPGMMLPGVPAGRAAPFAGIPPQQGGRGAISGAPQVPPNAFGLPGQMPFGAIPQPGPGGYPNGIGFPQALAQVQALGRGGPGGRGQIQGMQGVPQPMMALQGMRGRDGRPQYPAQQPRGGLGMNIGMQQGQISGFPQQSRAPPAPLLQPNLMQSSESGPVPTNLEAVMSAPPGQQKQMIGEALFPKIRNLQPDMAGKITGMLLEMDNAELMGL
jgi:polyadenylate-binding protein